MPVLLNAVFYEKNKKQLRKWLIEYRDEPWFKKRTPKSLSPSELERIVYVPLLSVMNGLHTRDLFYKYLSHVDANLIRQVYAGDSRFKDTAGTCP